MEDSLLPSSTINIGTKLKLSRVKYDMLHQAGNNLDEVLLNNFATDGFLLDEEKVYQRKGKSMVEIIIL